MSAEASRTRRRVGPHDGTRRYFGVAEEPADIPDGHVAYPAGAHRALEEHYLGKLVLQGH